MILKVCKTKIKESNDERVGSTETITEFYDANSFIIKNGMAISDKRTIPINDYEQLDEIDDCMVNYKIEYAFLMNNEGKTIEKLV